MIIKTLLTTIVLTSIGIGSYAESIKPVNEIFEPKGNFTSSTHMKVAVIQWAPPMAEIVDSVEAAEKIKSRNRAMLESEVRKAASNGATLIITSEMGIVGYPDIPELPDEDDNFRSKEEVAPFAETVPGTSTEYFAKIARELGVYIQIGLIEKDKNEFHNSAVAIGPNGEVLATHRKVSLYHQENDYFTPGKSTSFYQTPAGVIGMLICADVYHGSLLRAYTGKANVLALSTSWAQMNTGWNSFTRAAISTKSFLLAANQPYFPDSGVINPDGSAQSHIRQTTYGIAYGYLPIKSSTKSVTVKK